MVPLKCISSFAQRRILNLNVLSHCASLDGHNRPFIEKKNWLELRHGQKVMIALQ